MAVNGMATHRLEDGTLLLVSTSGDDQVVVWSNDAQEGSTGQPGSFFQGHWKVRQLIKLPLRLQHSVSLAQLPGLPDWCALKVEIFLVPQSKTTRNGRGQRYLLCYLPFSQPSA